MKHSASVLLALAATALVHPAAPAAGQSNHLFCYDVKDDLNPGVVVNLGVDLQPEFSLNGCTVAKVTKFCVPATKQVVPPAPAGPNITGPPLRVDYICYQLKNCPNVKPDPIGKRLVADQFGGLRDASNFNPSELCVPAVKRKPPCFRIGNGKKCGGVCPNLAGVGTGCVFDETIQDCTCAPQPCGGKPDKAGQCGGECPSPLVCQPGLLGTKPGCGCMNPPPPPCDFLSSGVCGGFCNDPAAQCIMNPATTGPPCVCQPPDPGCAKDTAGQCSTTGCPPGLVCTLDDALGDCRCAPPTPPCGPNPLTGECGGTCPAGSECRFTPPTPTNPGGCNCEMIP
jgi:hypothetical protein